MEELLLINPSARPSKRKGKKMAKRRTAAQKRATAKLVAFNRSRRTKTSATRPSKRLVARRRKNTVKRYYPNPAPRKRRAAAVMRRVKSRKYRRNPSPRAVVPMLTTAFTGAIGAMAVNTLYNFLPLPATLKTGNMQYVAKGALAIAVGVFGNKLLPSGLAGKLAQGSLTVTAHDALKNIVGPMFPSLGLGYYAGGQVMTASPRMNASPAPALSEYVNTDSSMAGMGEYVGNSIY